MQIITNSKLILVIASIASSISAAAQQSNDKDSLFAGLQLDEVQVLAQPRTGNSTTSYKLNRMALDHHQMLNIKDISSLLPGGKTVNSTLTDDSRLSIRSSSGERGNAAFGTAVEIDGIRLDNNSMMDETLGASTRNISSSNVESIEIISGIPSVEYGDISNGIVKVNTRHGLTPFIFEASSNPYTWQVSLNKGFKLTPSKGASILNASFEHAVSYINLSSPHTSYQRNNLSLSYSNTLIHHASTFNIRAGVTGNIGGYNSESDPDAFNDTYTKVRDNQLRGNIDLSWLYEAWRIGNLKVDLHGAFSTSDKRKEDYINKSSSSSQPLIHVMEEGYHIAIPAEALQGGIMSPAGEIILGPTGYWYERSYNDQKPLTFQMKLKGTLTSNLGKGWQSKLLLGAEYNTSRNNGRGQYYEDYSIAPTWRPYRYDELPTLKNLAIFAEEQIKHHRLLLTFGLRDDITMISRSEYGNASSFSPRVNAKYDILSGGYDYKNREKLQLSIHGGYGKSVKLPSFQVLYPQDEYFDKLAFTPGSTADNKAFYAYNTHVSKAIYNSNLRWQHTNQFDLGMEASWRGARLTVSFFHNTTKNPYQQINLYTPIAYNYTSQAAIEGVGISSADRQYAIDRQTGIVSVSSINGGSSITLPYSTHHTYNLNRQYVNGSPVRRYGLEWILDLPQFRFGSSPKLGGITLRLDGNYYHYKGIDQTLFAGVASGIEDIVDGNPVIGYYLGNNASSTSSPVAPSVSNGVLSKQCNLNATLTAHIPKIRLIVTLRIEASFLNYKRQLSEANDHVRGIMLDAAGDVFGKPYDPSVEDKYVALYPEYYSTWSNPEQMIPFADALARAKDTNDTALYQQLSRLIVRSNTSYYLNPQRISAFYSTNISVTKEIGRWLSISFYANNFLNSMQKVYTSQVGLEQSLFNGGYIPKFYYGMSVRLKL